MKPINPAHGLLVVFDHEWLANVHPFPIISTIILFYLFFLFFFLTGCIDTNLVEDNADDILIILPKNV